MTEKGGVQSVERIFQLIEQLASPPAGASLQRLAQETGLAKSTVHRLLASLVSLGYAAQEPETGRCFGRTYADSPDIDGRVLFSAARSVSPGEFVMVRITGAEDGDLVGEMEENA